MCYRRMNDGGNFLMTLWINVVLCIIWRICFGSWNIDSERFPIGTCEFNRQVALVVSVSIITCGHWSGLTSHWYRRHARIELVWAEKSQVCNPWISYILISDVFALFQIEPFVVIMIFICLFSLDDNFVWNYFFVRIFFPWYTSMCRSRHSCSINFPHNHSFYPVFVTSCSINYTVISENIWLSFVLHRR